MGRSCWLQAIQTGRRLCGGPIGVSLFSPDFSVRYYYLIAAGFVVLAMVQHSVRGGRARSAARNWLHQHKYRTVSLKTPWFGPMFFKTSWNRDTDNAYDFEATVEDTELGGTGTIQVRVRTGWLGGITEDIEVVREDMSEGSDVRGSQPLWERLADAQLDILRRIADGETSFYAPRKLEAGGGEFNELVEHVLALTNRGMVTSGAPRLDDRNLNQYVSIGNLSVTEDGRRWLESQESQG